MNPVLCFRYNNNNTANNNNNMYNSHKAWSTWSTRLWKHWQQLHVLYSPSSQWRLQDAVSGGGGGGGGGRWSSLLRRIQTAAGGSCRRNMGNTDSKLLFRKAVIQLTTKTQVPFIPIFYSAEWEKRSAASFQSFGGESASRWWNKLKLRSVRVQRKTWRTRVYHQKPGDSLTAHLVHCVLMLFLQFLHFNSLETVKFIQNCNYLWLIDLK